MGGLRRDGGALLSAASAFFVTEPLLRLLLRLALLANGLGCCGVTVFEAPEVLCARLLAFLALVLREVAGRGLVTRLPLCSWAFL